MADDSMTHLRFAASTAQNLRDALLVVDDTWHIRWMNDSATSLLTQEESARPSTDLLMVLSGATRERLVGEALAALRTDARWNGEGELAGESSRPVSIACQVLHSLPDEWLFSVEMRDATPRLDAERRLQDALRAESAARVAATLAHELADLLTAITGSADLLASDPALPLSLGEDVETVRQSADRAGVVTRQLVRASRSHAASPQLADVTRAVLAMEPMLRRSLGDRVTLGVDCPGTAIDVRVDLSYLELALYHLACNADAAMPRGGHLHVIVDRIVVATPHGLEHSVVPAGAFARIRVRDDGTGMDRCVRERCFEPLFSSTGGAGLGLSVVFGIVTQCGGHVSCDSTPGAGTTLTLLFPVASHRAPLGVRPGTARCILLVDDEEVVRRVTARALRREGYRVFEASTADEALVFITREPHTADLLLTDVVMPGLSGVDLALCVLAARPDMRILFTSGAHAFPGQDAPRLPHGAHFLPKPFTPQALSARVRDALVT